MTTMLTIIESHEFVSLAKTLKLSDNDLLNIKSLLTSNPDIGTPLGSELYKVRIARKGSGKSGGYRVIIFIAQESMRFICWIFTQSLTKTMHLRLK